jgi:hypothetical protein
MPDVAMPGAEIRGAGIMLPSFSLIIGISFFLFYFSSSRLARFSSSGSMKSSPD